MNSVIEVKDLYKVYRLAKPNDKGEQEFEAVQGISFIVENGEIFGILGPNGAGKTTTLEIIEGIKQQTSGTVKVLGFNNLTQTQEIKKRIGVQLQSSNYLPALSLKELLNLFSSIYDTKKNPNELLGLINLEDKADELVKNLSGGQKQRFSLATTLVNNPEIIFLDEPTTGLDPKARRDLWFLVKEINARGITIILTTHYMEEAEFLCNRVAIMDHGEILKIDEPKKLVNDLAHTTQISFLTDGDINESIWQPLALQIEKIYNEHPKIVLEIKSLDIIGQVVNILRNNNINFSGFTVRTASLEDVYLDLTGREYEE